MNLSIKVKMVLLDYIKNLPGWNTKQKLVVISADDYGNVRLDSRKARENMNKSGLKIHSRFDAFDTLETRDDLEALYEVLTSVKDKNGNYVVFTPYTLPCNIDFEKVQNNGYSKYYYEKLPVTFLKLKEHNTNAYSGAWNLWNEGIAMRIMAPQFHGREHFNLKAFERKLNSKDEELLTSLKNRSLTSISSSGIPNVGWTAAFSFNDPEEIQTFPEILKTGTDAFESVFGYRSESFTPPAQQFPKVLEKTLRDYGIKNLDKPFTHKRHLGNGKYKRTFNFLGSNKKTGLNTIVRNVVFEPTNGNINHVEKALQQISAAFTLGKPANISSHRVNYCGLIDEKNRKKGLSALEELLRRIVEKWPDVEFVSTIELGKLIEEN